MMSAAATERVPPVTFERAYKARLVGIDGTWWRPCEVVEVSASGAQIAVDSYPGKLDEFFLVLSSVGTPAHRRCKAVWIRGGRMGVQFLGARAGRKRLSALDSRMDEPLVG